MDFVELSRRGWNGREGKGDKSLDHRRDMGKGMYISTMGPVGCDGGEEEEEIMVGYLTDWGSCWGRGCQS